MPLLVNDDCDCFVELLLCVSPCRETRLKTSREVFSGHHLTSFAQQAFNPGDQAIQIEKQKKKTSTENMFPARHQSETQKEK